MNEFIQWLSQLDPLWVYAVIFSISFLENIFPPSPSDSIVVFGGALAAIGHGNFFFALFAGVAGGTFGFMTMYGIGKWFGRRIIETGKIKFLPLEDVHKVEQWFTKYGDWIIIANRFLSGTRAVISFFAGISQLNLIKTTILSFLSSLAWYTLLVYAGYSLGHNWIKIHGYLATYGKIITGILIVLFLIALIRFFIARRKGT